jgi:ZIP family zinc transporter
VSGVQVPLVFVVGLVTGAATLLGGAVALRFQSALGLLLGVSSGAIIGVALFDLLPEALDLSGESHSHLSITTAVAIGFGLYLVADRASAILMRGAGGPRSHFAPASLTAHSLMDGLGIGLAFQVSTAMGLIVALAVLTHDILDGANTVTLSLAGGAATPAARGWLIADAAAPLVGIAIARTISVPPFVLANLLGGFAGVFLYIGASELLPRSQDRRPRLSTIAATGAGFAFVYAVIRLAGA